MTREEIERGRDEYQRELRERIKGLMHEGDPMVSASSHMKKMLKRMDPLRKGMVMVNKIRRNKDPMRQALNKMRGLAKN